MGNSEKKLLRKRFRSSTKYQIWIIFLFVLHVFLLLWTLKWKEVNMKKNLPKGWVKKRNYAYSTSSSNSWRTLLRSIEPDDVKRLLRKRFTPRNKCMILMLLRTGMRICELLALKLQDINLKERTVIIHKVQKSEKEGSFT